MLSDNQILERLDGRPIVLVGLMGAGKSRIGSMLAERFGIEFLDADNEIEAAAGCSIAEIFDRFGETEFRAGERRVMKRLMQSGQSVISTGGGAFIDPETRALVRQAGFSVWLRASLEILVSRTSKSKRRPLLNEGDPEQILKQLIEQRYPVYGEADVMVDSENIDRDVMVERVVRAIADHIEGRDPARSTA